MTPIVFINLWPEGGMRHYSESLVAALRPAVPVELVQGGITTNPLRLENWRQLARLAVRLRRRPPLAVHLNNDHPLLLALFPLLAAMNSVITLHDAVPHAGERLAKRLFTPLHLLAVAVCIRKVIIHSEAIRDQLPRWFPRRKVRVLPHVNYGLWAAARRPAPPAPPLTVLFFGRILPYKGLPVLLAAMRRLPMEKFRLIIAGAGEVGAVDLPNVEVRNHFVAEEEMAELFNAAHVVALPYIAASQSGVAYMAFAFERPVVATSVGALPDVVRDGENGFLVPPSDDAALAPALEKMADAATRTRLTETIRAQNVSDDVTIRTRLLEIYHESAR